MAAEEFDLSRVISPISLDDFLNNYWEKKPLLIQREDRDYYSGLLSLDDVDGIVSSRDLRTPALKLVKKGSSIPTSSYTANVPWGGDVFTNVVDTDKVFLEYQRGATIVLQALHRSWRPLGIFCRDLERQFNYPLQTNIYLTPPSAQGFAAHYDTHDVFVLQTAGQKHWLVYNSPVPLPDKHKPFDKATTPPAELLFEVDLKAGDMMYLPRGFVHEALTSDQLSLHITVGVVVYTWGDVLAEVLEQLRQNDPRFRQSLQSALLSRDNPAEGLRGEFEDLVAAFGAEGDLEGAMNTIARRFLLGRLPLAEGRLQSLNEIDSLDLQTPLRQRVGLISRLYMEGDQVIMRYEGKRITLPDYVAPLLRFILDNKNFRAADLPGGVDDAGKLTLVRRLIKEGFLVIDRGK